MDGHEYIAAFADIPDDLIRSASDDAAVRRAFRLHRSHRNKMIGALCCCIVIAAAVGFGAQNWFRKPPAVLPGETTSTDPQTQTQQTGSVPGVIPSETISATETESLQPTTVGERPVAPASETENHPSDAEIPTERQPTGNPDRQELATRLTEPVTDPVNQAPSEEPTLSVPVTEPAPPVQIGFTINKITNQISGAPKYYSPDTYDTFYWTYAEISGYYGVDYRSVLTEIGFHTDAYDAYRIITDKNGNMANDTVSFLYQNSEGSSIKLSASKTALPYDSVYELESSETSTIQGTDVLIGGFPTASAPDGYVFFFADFDKNNIHYRVTGNHISARQFYETIERIIT